jgi:hypothetical protein
MRQLNLEQDVQLIFPASYRTSETQNARVSVAVREPAAQDCEGSLGIVGIVLEVSGFEMPRSRTFGLSYQTLGAKRWALPVDLEK